MAHIKDVKISGSTYLIEPILYAQCTTGATTTAKAVTLANFELTTGAAVDILFTNTNTKANPTLNVGGTGAKAIWYHGAAIPAGALEANRVYRFVYDATSSSGAGIWHLVGDINANTQYQATTTSIGSASAGTAIPADDITKWTTNTPTAVTKKTVVTGGSKTAIPNITKKTVVTSATAATASYSNGVLTITNGSVQTGDSVTTGTAIQAYTSLTTGDSVDVTPGTAAVLNYTAKSIPNITVTSTTVATGITEK